MGSDARRRQEIELKRQDILDAAERVFFRKGFENASMDEVAREAQYSKRTVYVYFNGKDEIYFEIMIRGYRVLIGLLNDAFAKDPPQNAPEALRRIFFTFFGFSTRHPDYFKAIMNYETAGAETVLVASDARAQCYRLGEVVFGYLVRALQMGTAQGCLPPGLDCAQAALILWACTVGVFNTAEKKADYLKSFHGTDPESFVTGSFELILNLLTKNGGNPV